MKRSANSRLIATAICILAAGLWLASCSAKQAGKDAGAAQAAQAKAQSDATTASQNAQTASTQANAANAALQANPSDANLQAAAKAAQAKLDSATSALTAANDALAKATQAAGAATDNYNRAVEKDNATWNLIGQIAGPVGLALGLPIGGLVDPFRKLVTGQTQGAKMAANAIASGLPQSTLSDPNTQATIQSAAAAMPPHVQTEVNAAI